MIEEERVVDLILLPTMNLDRVSAKVEEMEERVFHLIEPREEMKQGVDFHPINQANPQVNTAVVGEAITLNKKKPSIDLTIMRLLKEVLAKQDQTLLQLSRLSNLKKQADFLRFVRFIEFFNLFSIERVYILIANAASSSSY